MAVVVVEGDQKLYPLNRKATELFEKEGLRGDLVTARPSHPLSELVARLTRTDDASERVTLTFPSGERFEVEASRRSEKGNERWLVLLIEPHRQRTAQAETLEAWGFTPRERQVVEMMILGASSSEICEALDLAPNTLKTHVKSALTKTDTRTRAELVAKVLRG
jgi:DNA-binding CsgD family transcriptional regulator